MCTVQHVGRVRVLLLSFALSHGGLAGLRLLVFRGRSGSGRHIAAGKVSV